MARDPYKYFRVEARDLFDQLGKGVLDLEKGAAPAELVARLFRLAHTLKGAARVVKAREIADCAHAIEDTLEPFRQGGVSVPGDRVDRILQLLDEISARTAALGESPSVETDSSLSSVQDDAVGVSYAAVEELDTLVEGAVEASIHLSALRRGAGNLERACRLAELLDEHFASTRSHRLPNDATPKVRLAAADLHTLIKSLRQDLVTGAEQVDRELRQVREVAERLRLTPASVMFGLLERAGRDVAQSLGKKVDFAASGGDVRLDARVLTIVQSALVQLVRNAVAHGIESEQERAAAGKDSAGHLLVRVRRTGSRIAFTCRDDGRGVDLEGVRRAAQRKGVSSADVRALGTEKLLDLLLAGGLTTAGTATDVSGRGVGLDVVRESANRLGGEVRVQTEKGKGTTFELIVPVSLTSVDGLLVEVAGRTAVVPLDSVRRIIRLAPADVAQTATGASVGFEGTIIPFAPLSRALRSQSETGASPRSWSAFVVEGGNALCAFGVDRLVGTQTVVVRPLQDAVSLDPIVAGACLDAEGNPQLVLEPENLVKETLRAEPAVRATPMARRSILVIDDSLTTRMLEASILESAGYEVELAVSGEDGFEKARRQPFALFLVDVEMPGMDGFEFIERARAEPALREIPAILVTSRSSPEAKLRGERVGAVAYIVKSEFDQNELLDRIAVLVRPR